MSDSEQHLEERHPTGPPKCFTARCLWLQKQHSYQRFSTLKIQWFSERSPKYKGRGVPQLLSQLLRQRRWLDLPRASLERLGKHNSWWHSSSLPAPGHCMPKANRFRTEATQTLFFSHVQSLCFFLNYAAQNLNTALWWGFIDTTHSYTWISHTQLLLIPRIKSSIFKAPVPLCSWLIHDLKIPGFCYSIYLSGQEAYFLHSHILFFFPWVSLLKSAWLLQHWIETPLTEHKMLRGNTWQSCTLTHPYLTLSQHYRNKFLC